jgi:hypothetical protein
MSNQKLLLRISLRELNTVLAALRFYQEQGQCDSAKRSESIGDVATNGGHTQALTGNEIDELCERINTS